MNTRSRIQNRPFLLLGALLALAAVPRAAACDAIGVESRHVHAVKPQPAATIGDPVWRSTQPIEKNIPDNAVTRPSLPDLPYCLGSFLAQRRLLSALRMAENRRSTNPMPAFASCAPDVERHLLDDIGASAGDGSVEGFVHYPSGAGRIASRAPPFVFVQGFEERCCKNVNA